MFVHIWLHRCRFTRRISEFRRDITRSRSLTYFHWSIYELLLFGCFPRADSPVCLFACLLSLNTLMQMSWFKPSVSERSCSSVPSLWIPVISLVKCTKMVIYAATVWIRNGGTERALLSKLQFIPRAYNYLKCHPGKNAMHTNSHTPTHDTHWLTTVLGAITERERQGLVCPRFIPTLVTVVLRECCQLRLIKSIHDWRHYLLI